MLRFFRHRCPCLPCCKTPVDQGTLPKLVVNDVSPNSNGIYRLDICVDDKTFQDTEEQLQPDQELRSVVFVCISDTHSRHSDIPMPDDPNYILIHTGDFSSKTGDLTEFNTWLGTLPFKEKIIIAGNHEVQLSTNPIKAKQQLSNCTRYLHGSSVTVRGVTLFGSPHHPKRGCCYKREAFGLTDQDRSKVFLKVPKECHVLLSHCPPFGILDEEMLVPGKTDHVGCRHCLKAIQKRKPNAVIFGHCHQNRGVSRMWHGEHSNMEDDEEEDDEEDGENGRTGGRKGGNGYQNDESKEEVIEPATIEIELSDNTGKFNYRRRSSTQTKTTLLMNAASIGNNDANACENNVAPPMLLKIVFHRVIAAERELVGHI